MAANSFLVLRVTNVSTRISLIMLMLVIVRLSDYSSSIVRCQDFEDLNNNKPAGGSSNVGGASQQPQSIVAFQPSRQSAQSPSSNNPNQFQTTPYTRQSFQRPILSNRFAQQQQQLSAQASTISNTVVSSQQQQQQTLPQTTTSNQQQSTTQTVAAPGNIEQIMKNALNRASKLEQSNGNSAEGRQDLNTEPIQSRAGSQFQSMSSQANGQSLSSPRERSVPATPADNPESTRNAGEESEKQTTPQISGTANAHETVYSDQRFASLFARRANQKKNKFTPTEQVKAKPTLPSFIKSPPDPKQFNANSAEGQDRPITQASANLVSARLQQQQSNQNRQPVNLLQKKPAAITSNTATAANNKRLNSQKQPVAAPSSKASNTSRANGSQASANVTNKPVSGNPFNKQQQSSSDPANVIAMARRRLLANNAVQQQQRPAANK